MSVLQVAWKDGVGKMMHPTDPVSFKSYAAPRQTSRRHCASVMSWYPGM
jgi:hypothetical protein